MSRRTAVALALAVTGGLLIAPQALPASASLPAASQATQTAASRVAPTPLVQGVVVDQFGHDVDDVDVRATRADGSAAASALTYASAWADGPQHGYFFLEVGATGTYTLRLSKTGYTSVKYGPFTVTRPRQRLSLGELEIKKTLAATKISAALQHRTVTTGQKGVVAVVVSTSATAKPVGTVEIREGRSLVGSGNLKAGAKGRITVVLAKLGKGAHVLKATFTGSPTLKASSTSTFTLVVKKSKH